MSAGLAFVLGFVAGVTVLCVIAWLVCETEERRKKRENPPVPDAMPEHLHAGPIEDRPLNRIVDYLPWWEN